MRVAGMLWFATVVGVIKFTQGFSVAPKGKPVEEEENFRLLSIFNKNKYGYNTRFMSDFEVFLESVLNEKFLDNSVAYYDNEMTGEERDD